MTPYRLINGRIVPRPGGELDFTGYVTDGGDGVVIILKGASRSMIDAASKIVVRKKDDKRPLPNRMHVFVRDPIERLQSVYKFFRAHPPIEGREERGKMLYSDFIDAVLAGAKNAHWRPVTETLSHFAESDVVVHLFENLAEEFPLGKLAKKNASKPVEQEIDLTYREAELKTFYAGDYQLRRTAK